MYKYPYMCISLTLSELYHITLFSYGIWICGYKFLNKSIRIACKSRCISDPCFSPPEQYFSGGTKWRPEIHLHSQATKQITQDHCTDPYFLL